MKTRIYLTRPVTDEDEILEIRSTLQSGHLTQGPKTIEFEKLVAAAIGSAHAFATSSGTTALHLSLAALGIGPGDEVIIPDFTFPATANVVVQQGAKPVLADIHLDTFSLHADDVVSKITPRTKAIIPVHPFGMPADMEPLLKISRAKNIPIVEDAACALGARLNQIPCGRFGTTGCFSFHPRKSITTGEGGMIVTDDAIVAKKIELLRRHGGVPLEGVLSFEAAGYNYRLSDIHAAMGVAQMRKLTRILEERRATAMELTAALATVPGLKLPRFLPGAEPIYQSYVVLLDDNINRDGVIAHMGANNIETTIGTYALHAQPYFKAALNLRPGDIPQSFEAYRRALTLPLHVGMRPMIPDLVSALEDAIDANRR